MMHQNAQIYVQFLRRSILSPQKGLEFPEGWVGVRKNPFRGGGMDILWNYTMSLKVALYFRSQAPGS